jgi:hypothetical protein
MDKMNTYPAVPVDCLCDKHIRSAHGEPYKILFPNLKKGKSIMGYLINGCIYLPEFETRHDELAKRLKNHKTPITDEQRELLKKYMEEHDFYGWEPTTWSMNAAIDKQALRCSECKNKIEIFLKKSYN